MGRAILAVVAAEVMWTVCWLGGMAAAAALLPGIVDPAQPLTHTGVLVGYVGYSVLLSLGAGWVVARVKGSDPMRTVWVFAGIQLAIGVGMEISYWAMTPVWYHLVFLALLVPATVQGGRMGAKSGGTRRVAATA